MDTSCKSREGDTEAVQSRASAKLQSGQMHVHSLSTVRILKRRGDETGKRPRDFKESVPFSQPREMQVDTLPALLEDLSLRGKRRFHFL